MRAGYLPSPSDLQTGEESPWERAGEERKAVEIALRALEVLVGYPIRAKTFRVEVLLGREPVMLEHFPVWGFKIEGRDAWDLDAHLGVIYPDYRAPVEEIVSYSVGYEDGEFPALIVEGVTLLSRMWLARCESGSEEVRGIVEVCRRSREKLRKSISGR